MKLHGKPARGCPLEIFELWKKVRAQEEKQRLQNWFTYIDRCMASSTEPSAVPAEIMKSYMKKYMEAWQ
jgi:hypothetical protein